MSEPTTEELVAMLASAPDTLEATLASQTPGTTPAMAGGNGGEESWGASEIVGHLCDAARYWGGRMRLTVHEDNPQFEPFDQDALVRMAAYRYMPAATLAREFRLVSEANVALLRGLSAEQWARVGTHAERGQLTLREMVIIEAEHELAHARHLPAGN